MIKCEHFIYNLWPDEGYKLLKSLGVTSLISSDTLRDLCLIGEQVSSETIMEMWWHKEKVVTISFIRPTQDKDNRKGSWNHTIIIPIMDYLKLTQPKTIFAPYFIKELTEPPESLESITIGEATVENPV